MSREAKPVEPGKASSVAYVASIKAENPRPDSRRRVVEILASLVRRHG